MRKSAFRSLAGLAFIVMVVMLVMVAPALPLAASVSADNMATQVYQQVSPSVVALSVSSPQGAGGGSGFVVDQQGHIVTNYHVVNGAQSIIVSFLDGTLTRARIIGLDADSDLAVIKVDDVAANKLIPVVFADSDELVVGADVFAIGSPFGQRWTLTKGIISALDRTIEGLDRFSIGGVIQTDAAINPGNSGGPLLDASGRVIGVNSQILSSARSNSGVGFAIPSNLVQRVAESLIEDGFVQYSYLGIRGGDVTLDVIEAFELSNDTRGVIISEILPGGPAARADLQPIQQDAQTRAILPDQGDIVTAINDQPLTGMNDLISYLARNTQPGDTVTLTILRNGTSQQVDVRLMPRP